jgi:hypothetical protein
MSGAPTGTIAQYKEMASRRENGGNFELDEREAIPELYEIVRIMTLKPMADMRLRRSLKMCTMEEVSLPI